MQKFVGKMIFFLTKLIFVISVLGAILSFTASALSEYLPFIAQYTHIPVDKFGLVGYMTGGVGVLSGIGLKVTSYINTVNKVNTKFITQQNKIQKEYFDNGIDNIKSKLQTQQESFNEKTNLYKQELQLKSKEIEQLKKQVELQTRQTAELKKERLGEEFVKAQSNINNLKEQAEEKIYEN